MARRYFEETDIKAGSADIKTGTTLEEAAANVEAVRADTKERTELPLIKRKGKKVFMKEVVLEDGTKVLKKKTKTRSRQKNLRKDNRKKVPGLVDEN